MKPLKVSGDMAYYKKTSNLEESKMLLHFRLCRVKIVFRGIMRPLRSLTLYQVKSDTSKYEVEFKRKIITGIKNKGVYQ